MVNYAGNPYGLGYYISKKALTACFDVWSGMYARTDLVFKQVAMLGLRSDQAIRHDGRQALGLDGPDQEPLSRIARRDGPRDFALARAPAEESCTTRCELSPRSARCGSVNDSSLASSRAARRSTDGRGGVSRARTATDEMTRRL